MGVRIGMMSGNLRGIAMTVGMAGSLLACPAPQTSGALMQEAATELNTQARFGRIEVALEHVAPAMRDAFVAHRAAWGGEVRLADYEMLGARVTAESSADVTLKVSWYRPEQQELRVTTLRQRWRADKGDWQLVSEARMDGDVGLIGEAVPRDAPREPRSHAQFPTVRIGSANAPIENR